MKRVIRIDRTEGEVTIDAEPGTGIWVTIELPQVTLGFRLGADVARKLGEGLTQAAQEFGEPST